ncbi:MAG TPA: hypothetical protein VLF90_02970 [Patescibacteria group bacterium]|nr:hypothetical protein [Patescibacteria group bacterium]
MASKVSKKKKQNKLALLKKPKLIVALIFILGFAGIGIKQLADSHAAAIIPATYYYNSGGIRHNSGFHATATERIGGIIHNNLSLWRWPKDNIENTYETTHSMWFGPYATIHIPPPYNGLHVCYYFSAWDDFGHTDTKIGIYIDMRFNGDKDYGNQWTPNTHDEPEYITTDGLLYGYVPTMKSHCYGYNVVDDEGRDMGSVEFRMKVLGSSDKSNSHIDLYKVTVNYVTL